MGVEDPELTISSSSKSRFVAEFEGLRGILAAWVVFGHILLISGFTYRDDWFGILFSPVLGVYAFMMLSGFVITAALDQRPSTWAGFMLRRFFRLFPVYALCMSLAIILFDVSLCISQAPAMAEFGRQNLERLQDVERNFGIYVLADVTLLQCLLPKSCYPHANETFLVPTWSLTIEWLFYIVAPFLIWMINRKILAAALGISGGMLLLVVFDKEFARWNDSFSINNAMHFLTGIASYYVWKYLPERKSCIWVRFGLWCAILAFFIPLNLPYKIWLAVMAVILYRRVHSGSFFFFEWPRQVLLSRPLQFLGRVSYVTYLLHWIVIEIVVFWLVQICPGVTDKFQVAAVCTAAVFPVTYVISDIIHRYLEVPLMNIPKRWGKSSIELANPC